jgi:two-component system KDP operon response regulator KdpE
MLVQNRGRLLTHNSLLHQVWGPAYTDARQTLRAHVANLRRKVEPAEGPRLIHTEPGVGYRLTDSSGPGEGHASLPPTRGARDYETSGWRLRAA